jgi:hypothetical protein
MRPVSKRDDLSWLINIKNRPSPICTSNDAVKILSSCEWEEPEAADRLIWDAENCSWNQKSTTVRVMRKVFGSGKKYGCMLMYDVIEQMVYVLKAGRGTFERNAFDSVRTQSMASNVAMKYNEERPSMKIHILPCWVYILKERDLSPAIRTEPLIVGPYCKGDLRHDVADASQSSLSFEMQQIYPAELESINLFELFSYHESDHQFLIWNPLRLGEHGSSSVVYWTEPSYFRSNLALFVKRKRRSRRSTQLDG